MRSAVLPLLALCTTAAVGQTDPTPPRFDAPVRLMAGPKLLGEGRLFPSPVYQDMNGDGLADLVLGDLRGLLTVALRVPGDGPAAFGAETKLLAVDGKDIDFHNW